MASEEYSVVFTTTATEKDARTLARKLVQERLVACAQIIPIHSVYTWEGAVTETGEWLLVLKSRTDAFDGIESYIQEHHPYEVPEILRIPVTAGYAPYLNWMTESTTGARS